MSTRAQVACIENNVPLYLYQHCDGYDVPMEVQNALKAAPDRWNDSTYLNRVIFSYMIMNGTYVSYDGKAVNPLETTTGYGISLTPCENAYHLIVLDHDHMRIGFMEGMEYDASKLEEVKWYTYKEYTKLSHNDLKRAYGMNID